MQEKNDKINQILDIWIGEVGSPSNMCVKTTDTVTTNAQGIGNGHINCQFTGNNACAMPAASGSRYFVVLTDHGSTNERFASTDVPLK